MKVKESFVSRPLRREIIKLRTLIVMGVVSLFFFIHAIAVASERGNFLLYLLLMTTLTYFCLKALHEWYHYFSISAPAPKQPDRIYTVDVFTTFCAGEPYDMLRQTLEAAVQMDYPSFVVWCCDEADDPLVRNICLELGVRHVTRTDKKDAKAGNINNALKLAKGELCLVLDPDHVPAPGFLKAVVPFFDDPGIGFVQVVQAYYNHPESLVAKGAAQQTYQFYGPMMMSMHAYGTVQAIGANCTFRRTALDSIGGHAAGLAEDMHTAMRLHAKGWRSVYHPAVLSRGLVPSTLSAYYKQQLKWSRGTFELLVTTYPRLFRKFTWRQRLHYFTLPFHYAGGLIFLINFLIPILSLLTGEMPLNIDITEFALASFPLFTMILLIRHYVQHWVAEETERGIHVVGGFLQIGTWWVHLLGMCYTLIRKKVPYIPTPKHGNDHTPLALNLPNLLVITASLLAIVFGLNYDLNPYSLFMAALAGVNVCIMVVVLLISKNEQRDWDGEPSRARKVKMGFWKWRHGVYAFMRKYAIICAMIVLVVAVWAYLSGDAATSPGKESGLLSGNGQFYWGRVTNGMHSGKLSGLTKVLVFDVQQLDENVLLPKMNSIVLEGAIPFIRCALNVPDKNTLRMLANGAYDSAWQAAASQLAKVNYPVFLNITQQTPQYDGQDSSGILFREIWERVHSIFENAGAAQFVWVWNADHSSLLPEGYPGRRFVDWLMVNIKDGTGNASFDSLYTKWHEQSLFNSGMPVMVAAPFQSGSGFNLLWWNAAIKTIHTKFPEVMGAVVEAEQGPFSQLDSLQVHWKNELRPVVDATLLAESGLKEKNKHKEARIRHLPDSLRGIVYDKGYHWFRNKHEPSRKALELDFREMKNAGINTVLRSMPGIYDQNIIHVADETGMALIPRVWPDFDIAHLNDEKLLDRERNRIHQLVKKRSGQTNIIAWSIGGDMLDAIERRFPAPAGFALRAKYLDWLEQVCSMLHETDTTRPVCIDVLWDERGAARLKLLKKLVPSADVFLLTADSTNKKALNAPLHEKTVWGNLPAHWWGKLEKPGQGPLILPAWQDMQSSSGVMLNGVIDLDGNRKESYDSMMKYWNPQWQTTRKETLPEIKILKPAKVVLEKEVLTYNLLFRNAMQHDWKLLPDSSHSFKIEWFLVKTDGYGSYQNMVPVGRGAVLQLTIPHAPLYYRLYVKISRDGYTRTTISTLNIPLY
ncbi:MAG: glycosyltransferase [Chitinophagaceae bacterium]